MFSDLVQKVSEDSRSIFLFNRYSVIEKKEIISKNIYLRKRYLTINKSRYYLNKQ